MISAQLSDSEPKLDFMILEGYKNLAVLISSLFMLFIFSCKESEPTKLCLNEKFMKASPYDVWPNKFTTKLPGDSGFFSGFLHDSLKGLYSGQMSFMHPIQLKLSNGEVHWINFQSPGGFPVCGINRRSISLFIPSYGKDLLLAGERVSIDSLEYLLMRELKSKRNEEFSMDSLKHLLLTNDKARGYYRSVDIDLDWNLAADSSHVQDCLARITGVFPKFYEEMSQQYFNKSLCELDSLELYAVKSCQCKLSCTLPPPPPPPPPPSPFLD